MNTNGTALYLQSSEVEERPAPMCFALETVIGSWTFQRPYREPQVNDARAWWPSSNAVAWEATVPVNLPMQLYIDGAFVCMAARYNNALELGEVVVKAEGTV
jgi:hypothetical protein